LKKDLNRGITDIQYNLLKLPQQLTFSSGKVVSYQYDAGGSKLKMSVTGAGSETRDYMGPFQYLNNALFEISHEEGRYSLSGGYEYFHKDHLAGPTLWQRVDKLFTLTLAFSFSRSPLGFCV
jgi:hypothetical protein